MDSRPPISPCGRLLVAAVSLAVGAALITARQLEPDPRGYGTHEQLGWAPCWFNRYVGRPCPACGMTTAWAYAVRGRIREAVTANAGGAAACGLAVLAGPWLVVSAARGRWLWIRPTLRLGLGMGTALAVLTVLDWTRRLVT